VNREQLENILQNAPVGLLSFSANWDITYVNENFIHFSNLYNFGISSVIGLNILKNEIIHGVNISDDLKDLEKGISFEKELRNLKVSEGKISVILKGSPFFEDKTFAGGIIIVEDLKIEETLPPAPFHIFENLENVFSKSSDLIIITNKTGEIEQAFGKDIRKFFASKEKLLSENIFRIFESTSAIELQGKISAVIEKREPEGFDISLKSFYGETFNFNVKILPLVNNKGHVDAIYFFMQDITEYKNKEKELIESLNTLTDYKHIVDNTADAIITIDLSAIIKNWNRGAEVIFGYKREEIIGKEIGSVFHHFDKNFVKNLIHELNGKTVWENEITAESKHGKTIFAFTKFILVGNTDNDIIIYCNDITQKLKQEKELKASLEIFSKIASKSSESICVLNPTGNIVYSNERLNKKLSYSKEELQNKNIIDFLANKSDINTFNSLYKLVSQAQEKYVLRFRKKTGEEFNYAAKISAVNDNYDKPKYYIAYFTEVEKEVVEAKDSAIFNNVFDNSPDGLIVLRNDMIIKTNDAFLKMFDYENAGELKNKEFVNLVSSKDGLKVVEYLSLVRKNKTAGFKLEFSAERKNGTEFYAEILGTSFEINEIIYILITLRDISNLKKSHQKILDSEARYRNVLEHVEDALYSFERIRNTIKPAFYTPSIEKITGYKQDDFLHDSRLFLKLVYPDDFAFLRQKIKSLLRNRVLHIDEFELRIINRHGNIVWIRSKINLIRNNDGTIQKIYGSISDISQSKKTEKELIKSKEDLLKLNETKDKFISIISHDLRTPFTSILGFTELLLNDKELSEDDRQQYIHFIQDSSKSMLALVNSLLDWTRLQTGRIKFEPNRYNGAGIIEKSIQALSGAAYQKMISLSSVVSIDQFISVDKDLIEQVFNNLISNAIKFTNTGGKIIISSKISNEQRFIEFSVKDDGIGIKEENLKNLFKVESKYTSVGTAGEKGTGLGLSLVKEIIEKHGGKIWVESENMKGSDFKFTLPLASAYILLVDYNKTDKILYSKIIKNITPEYNVITAANGKEALDEISRNNPALIITDHIMPLMNGYELALELDKLEMKNKPSIIVLSSDINRNEIQDYHNLGIEYVFRKPVDLSQFKQAIQKSLRFTFIRN
jgi:PAS domain S-box-containing protein